MNYLKNKRVYLSGPIEHGSPVNWRDKPKEVLIGTFKVDLFDPFDDPKQKYHDKLKLLRQEKNYQELAKIAKSFVRKDLGLVDRADFIVCHLPPGVPTTGTHHEIIVSSMAKKPTLLVSSEMPLWYYGFIPLEHMFTDWDSLYKYLHEVDSGKHMDDYRWAFVYGLV